MSKEAILIETADAKKELDGAKMILLTDYGWREFLVSVKVRVSEGETTTTVKAEEIGSATN